MFTKLRPPKDEEAERQHRLQSEKLQATAIHMLECAVERHDEAMQQGNFEAAGAHSETAGWWFAVLTGRQP